MELSDDPKNNDDDDCNTLLKYIESNQKLLSFINNRLVESKSLSDPKNYKECPICFINRPIMYYDCLQKTHELCICCYAKTIKCPLCRFDVNDVIKYKNMLLSYHNKYQPPVLGIDQRLLRDLGFSDFQISQVQYMYDSDQNTEIENEPVVDTIYEHANTQNNSNFIDIEIEIDEQLTTNNSSHSEHTSRENYVFGTGTGTVQIENIIYGTMTPQNVTSQSINNTGRRNRVPRQNIFSRAYNYFSRS